MTKYPLNYSASSTASAAGSNRYTVEATSDPIVNGTNLRNAIEKYTTYNNYAIFISPGDYNLGTENIILEGGGEINLIGLGENPEDHNIYGSCSKKGQGIFAVKTQRLSLKNLSIKNNFTTPYISAQQWNTESAWYLTSFTTSGAFTRCALSQNYIELRIDSSDIPGLNGFYTLESPLGNYDRNVYDSRLIWSKREPGADGKFNIHLALNVDSPLKVGAWEIFSYINNVKTVLASYDTSPDFYRWPWELKSAQWKNSAQQFKAVYVTLLNNEMNLENIILGSSELSTSMRSNMPYFGTFKNVEAGYAAFGGVEGYISGYLENCTAEDYSFGSRFYEDRPWPTSKSSFTDGQFINCQGLTYCFGAEGYIRGKFINCAAGHPTFSIIGPAKHGILMDSQSSVINYRCITNGSSIA